MFETCRAFTNESGIQLRCSLVSQDSLQKPCARARRDPGAALALAPASMKMLASRVTTHCPYCALQCGMHLLGVADGVKVIGNVKFPVNEGGLCVKGWSAAATLDHPER